MSLSIFEQNFSVIPKFMVGQPAQMNCPPMLSLYKNDKTDQYRKLITRAYHQFRALNKMEKSATLNEGGIESTVFI